MKYARGSQALPFFSHMSADDVVCLRIALKRDVPKSLFRPTGSASAHRWASHFK